MKSTTITDVLMCGPKHFQIDYEINPWMHGQHIDSQKAAHQWNSLVRAYTDLGIQVHTIEQVEGLPDMVFAADQAVIKGNTALMANFAKNERKGEEKIYSNWFQEHGYKLEHLPESEFFEGNGELLSWNGMYFLGTGFRSSVDAHDDVKRVLGAEVVPLRLINPYYYHLDTCLFPLDSETVFYYPEAFDKKSQLLLTQLVPVLLELNQEEAEAFCANSVATGSNVVCQKALPRFVERVNLRGFNVVEVDVQEFNKSGGGIHCLTNVLATR